jgi:PAS domain S-box-containing protein
VGSETPPEWQSANELQRLVDLSLDLVCIAGFDGYFKRVNPAFERTLGYSSQELLTRPFLDFVHADDLQASYDLLANLAPGKEQLIESENRVICADGSARWLQWNARVVPAEGLVYGVARDVTDPRRAHAELREAQLLVEASRDELRVLAEGQAALRRVATLVARGVPADEVFAAVAEEVGRFVSIDSMSIIRYEPDGTATMIARWTETVFDPVQVGARFTFEGENVVELVLRTGRPARMDSYANATGSLAACVRREGGVRSGIGAPIVVDGRLWGVMAAASTQPGPPPAGAEFRLAEFTELVATAISNAQSRADLAASRARIVAAADETRRRIERDLHDGAQQRLVTLGLELRAAEAAMPPDKWLRAQVAHMERGLVAILDELRKISRGIHPAILSEGGLGPALKALARRSGVPVELDVRTDSLLPERVEVAVYYVVAEALTNAAKHAHASVVHVDVDTDDSIVQLAIRDDGVGGADPTQGSGLIGLTDRVETLGGRIEITSPAGHGTSLLVRIPLDAA